MTVKLESNLYAELVKKIDTTYFYAKYEVNFSATNLPPDQYYQQPS